MIKFVDIIRAFLVAVQPPALKEIAFTWSAQPLIMAQGRSGTASLLLQTGKRIFKDAHTALVTRIC